ncbi:MAG: Holliday junction resolvase RuvX [Gallionella sp.]|nr:Holliday junction resolvase RuvX [Gallionella sp.]
MPDKAGCRIETAGGFPAQLRGDTPSCCVKDQGSRIDVTPQSSALSPVVGTLLAFDFGTQRIGVAVGNTFSANAQPLTTIAEEKNEIRFAAISALIREWQPCALLVGLPANDDGTPHELTALCRRFANRLHGRFALTTLLVDERYTSLAASEQLNKEGIRGRQQQSLIDQYAAQQIMQAWFDEPAACVTVGADRKKNE